LGECIWAVRCSDILTDRINRFFGENKWSIGQKSAKKDHKGRQKEEKTQKEADC
jgi:hypothetical protein